MLKKFRETKEYFRENTTVIKDKEKNILFGGF